MNYDPDSLKCPYCDCEEFENIWFVSPTKITADCMCCNAHIEITNDNQGSFIAHAELIRC